MKYLKNTILSIFGLLITVVYIPQAQALELSINFAPPVEAQTTSPTPEPTNEPDPSETPQPSPNPSATPPKSPTPSASTTPGISVTVGVTVPIISVTPGITISPTKILSPTIIPSRSASPSATPNPKPNTGGTNAGIPTTTPTPVEPAVTHTASPTPVPQTIANIQPPEPIQKIADNVYENVIVPPLSFLFQRPAQDFYKESSMTKSTSYSLLIVAAIAMMTGLFLVFPDRLARMFSFTKERFSAGRYLKFINPRHV